MGDEQIGVDKKSLTLDELCDSVDTPARNCAALRELIRRAKQMDLYISSKVDPKSVGLPPMPDPVNVWLYQEYEDGPWHPSDGKVGNTGCVEWTQMHYTIVPGILSLDQLAAHDIYIGCWSGGEGWAVMRYGQVIASGGMDTALQAQWVATGIAIKGSKS